MDTRADRTRSFSRNKGSRGRATTTTPVKDTDKQRKEGRCFHCNKQGHISRNCPKKKKEETKARKAETENSDQESDAESANEAEDTKSFGNAIALLRKTMTEEEKMEFIQEVMTDEDGVLSGSGF